MSYNDISEVNIAELLRKSYNWYRKRYSRKFKVRLQLIPIDEPDPKELLERKVLTIIPKKDIMDCEEPVLKPVYTKKIDKISVRGGSASLGLDDSELNKNKDKNDNKNKNKNTNNYNNGDSRIRTDHYLVESHSYEVEPKTDFINCEIYVASETTNNFFAIRNVNDHMTTGRTSFKSMICVYDSEYQMDTMMMTSLIESARDKVQKLEEDNFELQRKMCELKGMLNKSSLLNESLLDQLSVATNRLSTELPVESERIMVLKTTIETLDNKIKIFEEELKERKKEVERNKNKRENKGFDKSGDNSDNSNEDDEGISSDFEFE